MKKTKKFSQPIERQKTRLVQIKVSEAEKALFEAYALKEGTTISTVVRQATISAASDAGIDIKSFEGFASVKSE